MSNSLSPKFNSTSINNTNITMVVIFSYIYHTSDHLTGLFISIHANLFTNQVDVQQINGTIRNIYTYLHLHFWFWKMIQRSAVKINVLKWKYMWHYCKAIHWCIYINNQVWPKYSVLPTIGYYSYSFKWLVTASSFIGSKLW